MPKLDVVFEDKRLIAINKAPGIPFHSTDHEQGIVSIVREAFEENYYPVHRLDKMTSGLMIFAKDSESNALLSRLFEEKRVEKYYLGISDAKPNKKQGSIVGDMEKARQGSYKLSKTLNNPAITRFQSKHYINSNNENRYLLFLKPETGKTHQLRVASKAIGAPLLGDERYGRRKSDRGYLHAYKCRFALGSAFYELCAEELTGKEYKELAFRDTLEAINVMQAEKALIWPKGSYSAEKTEEN